MRARSPPPETGRHRTRASDAKDAVATRGRRGLGADRASGFTTAAETTEISGRGVGMDVVKHAVETAGGRLVIDGRRGAEPASRSCSRRRSPSSRPMSSGRAGYRSPCPSRLSRGWRRWTTNRTIWRDGRRFWNAGSGRGPGVGAIADVLGHPSSSTRTGTGMAVIATLFPGRPRSGHRGRLGRSGGATIVRPPRYPLPLCRSAGFSGSARYWSWLDRALVLDRAQLPLA
jgi:hypothetical protein